MPSYKGLVFNLDDIIIWSLEVLLAESSENN